MSHQFLSTPCNLHVSTPCIALDIPSKKHSRKCLFSYSVFLINAYQLPLKSAFALSLDSTSVNSLQPVPPKQEISFATSNCLITNKPNLLPQFLPFFKIITSTFFKLHFQFHSQSTLPLVQTPSTINSLETTNHVSTSFRSSARAYTRTV